MKKTISIEGMTCGNCVRHVVQALKEVKGVSLVNVDLRGKKAEVEAGDGVTDDALKAAISEAGYTALAVK